MEVAPRERTRISFNLLRRLSFARFGLIAVSLAAHAADSLSLVEVYSYTRSVSRTAAWRIGVPSILGSMAPTSSILEQESIVLRAYFDGGNKADSSKYKILTLAGYASTDRVWQKLEKRWNAALRKHGASHLHMTEAITRTNHFKGWSASRVSDLLDNLARVLTEFKKRQIIAVSCSVFLADYKRVTTEKADMPPVEQLCSLYCLGYALLWYAENILARTPQRQGLRMGYADLFFDRGEPFYGHIMDRWDNQKIRRKHHLWDTIRSITKTEAALVPGLQMADMLAWAINRPHGEGGHAALCVSVSDAIPRMEHTFKYDELRYPNREVLKRIKSLNLPRRAPLR